MRKVYESSMNSGSWKRSKEIITLHLWGKIYERCKKRKTLIIKDFITALSVQDRTSGQKIKRGDRRFNQHNQHLMNVYLTLPPKNKEYTFFSGAHRMLTKIDHILNCTENTSNFHKVKVL